MLDVTVSESGPCGRQRERTTRHHYGSRTMMKPRSDNSSYTSRRPRRDFGSWSVAPPSTGPILRSWITSTFRSPSNARAKYSNNSGRCRATTISNLGVPAGSIDMLNARQCILHADLTIAERHLFHVPGEALGRSLAGVDQSRLPSKNLTLRRRCHAAAAVCRAQFIVESVTSRSRSALACRVRGC